MAGFLTDDWFAALHEAAADLSAPAEVAGVVQFVVSGSATGKVQFNVTIDGGRITEVVAGKVKGAMASVTWSYDDAVAVFRGELDPDAAFMSGQAKLEGDYVGYLTTLRPLFGKVAMQTLGERLVDTAY